MEGLKILIRNLAFILLLATFLEMLLPNKSMKGFVQLVMGLFVIAAVLNPLADFLNLDIENQIPAWIATSSGDLPVIAAESNAAETGKSAVREQYKKILDNQIRILVAAIDGVESCEVDVELDKEAGGFGDYPQILNVMIKINESSDVIRPVEPVVIGETIDDNPESVSPKALEVKKTVSAMMQIPENIVTVIEFKQTA